MKGVTTSVIIPTYNHRGTVIETLDSVFAQTYTNYEIIIINDGSPDDTAAVLQPLIATGRIRYIEQANAGQAAARNRGITEARGEFIALLDDDDLWPPDKLEWQVAVLSAKSDTVLAYGYAQSFGIDESVTTRNAPNGLVSREFREQNFILSPGQTLIRASALKQVGGFDTDVWGADDWDLYIRLAEQGNFIYDHRPALLYRKHAMNASKDIWRMYRNGRRVADKHAGPTRSPEQKRLRRVQRNFLLQYAYQCIGAAQAHKRERDWAQVQKMLLTGIRIDPVIMRHPSVILGLAQASILRAMSESRHKKGQAACQ